MIKNRLSFSFSKEPLQSCIQKVSVEVLRTSPNFARQSHFFSKKEEVNEQIQSVVSRLSERLGLSNVFFAEAMESYIPEKGWKKTLALPKISNTKLPERPLRLLQTPQKIHALEDYFISGQKRWKATELVGPERISGEWWLDDKPRDYYRVKTIEGQELWVFQSPGSSDYFLHGIFD